MARKLNNLGFALTLLVLLLITGCSQSSQSDKLTVVATFYPIGELAKAVGADAIDLHVLIPNGAEPHDFELSPKDIRLLESADIIIINGAEFEHWAEQFLEDINTTKTDVIDLSNLVDLLEHEELEHEESHSDVENESTEVVAEEDHDHGEFDPHIWLSVKNMQIIAPTIASIFSQHDEANAEMYLANAVHFTNELQKIDTMFTTVFDKPCAQKEFIVSHAILGYFCRDYGCEQVSIEGLSPEAQTSAKDIAAIITHAREENIQHIFIESASSQRIAEVISEEINGSIYQFHALETVVGSEKGKSYLELMDDNANIFAEAFTCPQ